MIKQVYETLPCASYSLDPIIKAVRVAKLGNYLAPMELSSGTKVTNCYMVTASSKEIPPFAHPITIKADERSLEDDYIVIDVRGFMRVDSLGQYTITAKSDYDFITMRAFLQKVWNDEQPNDILNCGNIQLTAWIRWVSESIAQRLGLDPVAQMRVAAIIGVYYLSLFKKDSEDIKDSMLKMATQVARASYIPVEKVIEITEHLEPMLNVTDLCSTLAKAGETIRLEKFNPALLYGILCSGWFGANAREVVAAAIEHPPTWSALVFMSLTNRGYRNCAIARYVDSANKGDAGRTFTYNLARLPQHY